MLREIEEIDLLRLVEGDCSRDEAAALQAWIGAHPRRTRLLAEVRAVWRLTGSTTRSWVVAEAKLRLLRRGLHAMRRASSPLINRTILIDSNSTVNSAEDCQRL